MRAGFVREQTSRSAPTAFAGGEGTPPVTTGGDRENYNGALGEREGSTGETA